MANWVSDFLYEANAVQHFLEHELDEPFWDCSFLAVAPDDSDKTSADSDDEDEHRDSESEWEQHVLADADKDESPAKRFCAAIPTRRVRDKTTPITGRSAAEHRMLESFNVPQAFFLVWGAWTAQSSVTCSAWSYTPAWVGSLKHFKL